MDACIRRCKGGSDGLIKPGSHLWWKENLEAGETEMEKKLRCQSH